jgi:putative DNA primase/helicase
LITPWRWPSGDNWDKNPWLFAVANGVIDLKTGKLRPGKQSDMITMRSPVQYSPAAKAPRWTQFLNEIFDNNNELISWLQRYMGYCLTGSIKEQIIPIGYGNGANGKTVFIVVIRYVIGEYAYDAPFNTFELNNRNPIPNDLAALGGKRFVTSSETNEGSRFNEARIKSLTGGDSVTARFLHCEYFTYQPVAKFFLAVNHRPRVSDDSYGFWRRVRLIPFTRQFKGSADDKELTSKLIDEAPGILAWLVQGCLKWQNEGMESTPECIITATKEYESESDPLSGFILDECVISEQVHVQSSRLYKAYKDWCHGQGMQDKEILTLNAFGRRMGKNYKKSHKEGGAIYLSLALKADGFLTDSKAMFTGNTLNPHIDTRVENECENPSDSVIPSADNDLPPYPDKPCPVCDSECYRLDENNEYVCDDCRPLKKR